MKTGFVLLVSVVPIYEGRVLWYGPKSGMRSCSEFALYYAVKDFISNFFTVLALLREIREEQHRGWTRQVRLQLDLIQKQCPVLFLLIPDSSKLSSIKVIIH